MNDDQLSVVSWNQYFDECCDVKTPRGIFRVYTAGSAASDIVVVCFHGGGMSSLSFSILASLIKQQHFVIAFDFRGHGHTKVEPEHDLSAETLRDDAIELIRTVVQSNKLIVLVGHSVGGAIAVRTAAANQINIVGIVVIDVVEGTAVPALASMTGILRRRPKYFRNIPEALRWCTRSGTVQNIDSAVVSMPDQIVYDQEKNAYFWRTNLLNSEPHWLGWYEGLTDMFLQLRIAKMLVIAGIDRLDKTMTIAQMQGKLQVALIDAVGHVIHEDKPQPVAHEVLKFIARNRFEEIAILNAKIVQKKAPSTNNAQSSS